MRTYAEDRYYTDFDEPTARYSQPRAELVDIYDDRGDYFDTRRTPSRRKKHKAKKSHGFRNFVLLVLLAAGAFAAAKHYGLASPLSLLGLDIFGTGTTSHSTENIDTNYLIDMQALDAALYNVSGGYYPNEEEQSYLEQARQANPELADKFDLFTRHIDAYSRGAILTLYLAPEKMDYVLQDPVHMGESSAEAYSLKVKRGEIPLLMQYDARWGNHRYGSGGMGNTGCGPTCLSMVAAGLIGDGSLTPDVVADYAYENGYYVDGSGTSWSLFTQGAAGLGLEGRELPLDEDSIRQVLREGGAVILSVTRGDFTFNGHFIVVSGASGGKFAVCDPSCLERSKKLWEPEELLNQTAAAWGLTA